MVRSAPTVAGPASRAVHYGLILLISQFEIATSGKRFLFSFPYNRESLRNLSYQIIIARAKKMLLCGQMKGVVIVLVSYALSMVSYGALEMGHDLLHYLAEHHRVMMHNHDHDHHHHSVRDHNHGHSHKHTVSHHHETDSKPDEALPSLLSFFLFAETNPEFSFENVLQKSFSISTDVGRKKGLNLLPTTPPPEISHNV